MSLVTYYFNSYDSGGEEWNNSPENMVDSSVSSYTKDNSNDTVQLLLTNTCAGTDLGSISAVEIRAYGRNESGGIPFLRPVFGGTTDGSEYDLYLPSGSYAWTSYLNITSDASGPGTWDWSDVEDLDMDVVRAWANNNWTELAKVEIRVTYDSSSSSPSSSPSSSVSASVSASPSSSVSSSPSSSTSASPSPSASVSSSPSASLSPSSSVSASVSATPSSSVSASESSSPSISASVSSSPSASVSATPSSSVSASVSATPSSSVSSSPSSSISSSPSSSRSPSASPSASPSSSPSPSASYMYDPIVKAGCPQCGTYLYNNGGRQVKSDAVNRGRNDENRALKDNRYVRCARCGFICHLDRDTRIKKGATSGWGITNTKIERG